MDEYVPMLTAIGLIFMTTRRNTALCTQTSIDASMRRGELIRLLISTEL